MGVDIYAMKGLVPVPDDDSNDDITHLYDNPGFPGRAAPFKSGSYTSTGSLDMLSRSYGGYNGWRNQLAQLAGYASADQVWNASGGPFYELINFSDCEGTLGTLACAKLAQDFAEYQEKADAHPDEYFRWQYNAMRAGFEFAAVDGAVKFT